MSSEQLEVPLKRRDTLTRRLSRASTSIRRASLTRASTTLNTSLNRASTTLTRAFTVTSRAARRMSLPVLHTDTAPTSFFEAEFPSPSCFSPETLAAVTEDVEFEDDEDKAWGSPPSNPFQAFQWPAPSFGRKKNRQNTV